MRHASRSAMRRKDFGTLAVGKEADLILVRGNTLEDVRLRLAPGRQITRIAVVFSKIPGPLLRGGAMRRCCMFVLTALFVGTSGLSGQDTPPAPTQRFADVPSPSPVTDDMLQSPDPGDWLSWRRTLDAWGYSPLDEIDRDNVADLALVWSRPLSVSH